MAHWMDYTVAAQDSNFMEVNCLDATGESAIPNSFVVDAEGRLAWIGYPVELGNISPRILNNNRDIKEAISERNLDKHLGKPDRETFNAVHKYNDNRYMIDFFWGTRFSSFINQQNGNKRARVEIQTVYSF